MSLTKYGKSDNVMDYDKGNEWDGLWSEGEMNEMNYGLQYVKWNVMIEVDNVTRKVEWYLVSSDYLLFCLQKNLQAIKS